MNQQPLFRTEAVEYHATALSRDGRVLRIYPRWTTWAYWLLLAGGVASIAIVVLVRLNQYASGPAVVRVDARTVLTAVRAGTVASMHVAPGSIVAAGDLLVRMDDTLERADQSANLREIELQSRAVLLDSAAESARQALARLQATRKLLEAELESRVIRAPHAGLLADVRVRPGQHLAPGEIVCSLTGSDAGFTMVALLPGHSRPQLKVGAPLRLELAGYRYFYQRLTIDSISDEVVGPVEARRYLGHDVSDALPLEGPVVVVRARLPGCAFTAEGQNYRFFDGMSGMAEVSVRSERIMHALVPGLRELWSGWND